LSAENKFDLNKKLYMDLKNIPFCNFMQLIGSVKFCWQNCLFYFQATNGEHRLSGRAVSKYPDIVNCQNVELFIILIQKYYIFAGI